MNILLALSDSAAAKTAVNALRHLPFLRESEIILLVVVLPLHTGFAHHHSLIGGIVRRSLAGARRIQEEAAWELVEHAAVLLREAGARVLGEVHVADNVAKEILAVAVKWQPDLLVIDTRSCNRLQAILRGSVLQFVIERAPCPVLVVKKVGNHRES